VAPQTLAEAYERLREEVLALGSSAVSRHGLGVFLRRGMEGWMSVVSFSHATGRPPAAPPHGSGLGTELPSELTGMIVHHIAQMVLAHTEAS